MWHVLDPLAFVMAPTIKLTAGSSSSDVLDFRLDAESMPLSLAFHSSYWHDERFLSWLGTILD